MSFTIILVSKFVDVRRHDAVEFVEHSSIATAVVDAHIFGHGEKFVCRVAFEGMYFSEGGLFSA